MRIGIISPIWPPDHGGVAIYNNQMALKLQELGHQIFVFTANSNKSNTEDGSITCTRWNAERFVKNSWVHYIRQDKTSQSQGLFGHYDFMNAAQKWAVNLDLDIALISVPFQETVFFHARELYRVLQAKGIKVGALHYDISIQLIHYLQQRYVKNGDSWEDAASYAMSVIKKYHQLYSRHEALHRIGSPWFFEPDFVISTSHWSERFIDSPSRSLSFVLHPIVNKKYWQLSASSKSELLTRDILMINPQGRKGPQTMLHLIEDSDPNWTFRILEGGWGDAFKNFLPKLNVTVAFQEKRVDTEVFIDDMRKAYQSTRLVLFPSHVEGYGMTAIEPMYSGTPVLSSNYPAILEAVGEGAYTLCPFRNGRSEWRKATQEILNNHEFWCNKGFERVKELEERQAREIIALEYFLNQMCN